MIEAVQEKIESFDVKVEVSIVAELVPVKDEIAKTVAPTFKHQGPNYSMQGRMDAPRDDDDDFPEELDSFELDGTGSPKKLGISLGSSGGTGVKSGAQIAESPAKKEPILEGKLEQPEAPTGIQK